MDWNAIGVILCAVILVPPAAALSASITYAFVVDLIEQIRESQKKATKMTPKMPPD